MVLENMTQLFEKLNDVLLKKLIGRLKVFLAQKWSHNEDRSLVIGLFVAILHSIQQFFATRVDFKKDDEQIKCHEIIHLYVFITQEFVFSVENKDDVYRIFAN